MKPVAVVAAVVATVVTLLLGFEAAVIVVFGWPFFLARVGPRVEPDGPSLVVGAGAFVLFAAGSHAFARTWHRGWKARWTAAGVVGVVTLFGAGVAAIGVVHQIAWLATSDRPLTGPALASPRSETWNLKMIGMGLTNFHDTNNRFPSGDGLHGWATETLPYMGYYASDLDRSRSWNDPANRLYFQCVLPEFINPGFRTAALEDAEGFGMNHYAANVRVMGPGRRIGAADMRDGAANTVLVGEVVAGFRPWGHPQNWRDPADGVDGGPTGFGNPAGSGATFVMADGSVRFVSRRASPEVLAALATPSGGDDPGPP